LKDRIKFSDIYRIIRNSVDNMAFIASPSYEDYVATNLEARKYAESLIK
jgi:1-deoxy-D-xylulose-5-phosphate reductoisomerase